TDTAYLLDGYDVLSVYSDHVHGVVGHFSRSGSIIGMEVSLLDPSPYPSGFEYWDSSFKIDVLLEEWPTTTGGEMR
ncbi:hypothetical protein Tco_1486444, partial [Tanacetum coccineum]